MATITLEKKAEITPDTTTEGVISHVGQRIMPISIKTYISAMTTAVMSRRYALTLEIACGLAIFNDHGGTTRSAKRYIVDVYAAAGYDCLDPQTSSEYKTIIKRVQCYTAIYNYLGGDRVSELVGGAVEGMALDNLVKGLEPFEIKSLDGIMAKIGRPRLPAKPAAITQGTLQGMGETVAPAQIETKPVAETAPEAAQAAKPAETMEEGEIRLPEPSAKGEHTEEPEEVMPKFARRATDVGTKQAAANAEDFLRGAGDFVEIGTEHVSIRLSHDADKSEILKAALQLMEIADEMEAKQAQEKADSDSLLATKLMEEMRKMTTGKKAEKTTEGGLEPMKPAKGRRLAR